MGELVRLNLPTPSPSTKRCSFTRLTLGDCPHDVARDDRGFHDKTGACAYHAKVLRGLLAVNELRGYNDSPRFQEVRGMQLALKTKEAQRLLTGRKQAHGR